MFRNTISSLLTLSFACMGGSTLHAQDSWTLQACINWAVLHSAQMEVQHAGNRIQDVNLRDASLNLLPSVSGSSSAGYTFGRSPDPATNTYSNTQYFGNSYSLDAYMPLFNGFANINNVRFEKLGQLKGRKETQKRADDIAVEVLKLYYDVLYRKGLVTLAQEQVDLSAKEVARMRRYTELGLKAHADIADAEAKHASDEYTLINSQNVYEDALLNLKRCMSWPVDLPLLLEAAPEELRNVVDVSVCADSLYITALAFLPKSEASELGVRQARAALAVQKGLLFPRLSLGGGYGTGFYSSRKDENGNLISFSEQFSNNASQRVSISLSIPIFSGLNRWSGKQRAQQNLRIAEANHNDLMQEVYKEVQKAVQDLTASIKAYEQALKHERARELAYKVNEKKYEEGLISILDLHTSANLLLAAKVETIGSHLRMNAQRRLLAYYEGFPLVTVDISN